MSTPAPAIYAVRARASASGGAQADAGTETITFDASWGGEPSGLPGPAELRLVTSEPQRRIDLLHRNLRRYGTVYNTLAAACEVHGRVIAAQPPQPAPDPC